MSRKKETKKENMLTEIEKISDYPVCLLTKDVAKRYQQQITEIWNLIPLSKHDSGDILKEENNGYSYVGKWEHSLILLSSDKSDVIGFIVGYERQAEGNDEYPKDNLHLKSISISDKYQKQGLGRKLVETWIKYNEKIGFKHLENNFTFSVQTNGAEWNLYVQKLYESFGFKKTGIKRYKSKTDNIYFLENLTTFHKSPTVRSQGDEGAAKYFYIGMR